MAAARFRMTHQRQVILDELRHFTSHPTADELYEAVRKHLPRVSLGTVYRNLEVLTELGMITRIESGGPPMRFDANLARHYHIRCVACNGIEDIAPSMLQLFEQELEEFAGYQILGHRFELIGICPPCRERARTIQQATTPQEETA